MSDPTKSETQNAETNPGDDGAWSTHSASHDHAEGYQPTGVDMTLVGLAWVLLIVTLGMALRYLVRPGEKGDDHIKRRILHDGGPR